MPAQPFFITTAIDYTNGAPHIGHAYEKVLADVLARFRTSQGDDVFFLTGVDQHGQKVQQSAEKLGVAPEAFVTDVTEKFTALWSKLEIEYTQWAATTAPEHKACVQATLTKLWETGHLYKDRRSGFYSVRQEQFITEKERGPDGEFGEEWGEVVVLEEENYFFKLAEHRDWLLALLDRRPDLVAPAFRQAELRNAVEKSSGDLCVSRPKSRLSWGIEFPFDPDFVAYVWFDALLNYVSFAPGFAECGRASEKFQRYWGSALHVIGKDILVPAHGVYWPIMLKAMGFSDDEIPHFLVHGWWNIAGAKMSKSTGNVVDPVELVSRFGSDAVRYYLMRDIQTGQDADFSTERLVARVNSELANGLGNLLNRTLNMTHRYLDGTLPALDDSNPVGAALRGRCIETATSAISAMARYEVHAAIESVARLVSDANAFVDTEAPWKLAKDPTQSDRLAAVLATLFLCLRTATTLLQSVIPTKSVEIFEQLGCAAFPVCGENEFRSAFTLSAPQAVSKPTPVFPRIEFAESET